MKPIIFISSTFYDLKYIREDLANFVCSYDYEPVLFENGDIGYTPGKTLDSSCYESMRNSDMVILIIGGEYGSAASGENKDEFKEYMSVTRNEFKTAIDSGIPVFAMIDKNVMAEYRMYEANYNIIENEKRKLNFVSTKNINVLRFIKEVKEMLIIPIQEFEKSADIKGFISKQWADMLKNYLISLRNEKEDRKNENFENWFKKYFQNIDIKIDIKLESIMKNMPLRESRTFSDDEQIKNSQDNQSDEPSEAFALLWQKIIKEFLDQICANNQNYSIKYINEDEDVFIAIKKKFEEYKARVLSCVHGMRLDRYKLASCICGAIIEIKPLVGLNGVKISKYANEILALHVGLYVIKAYMVYELDFPEEDMYKYVIYMDYNFNMKFPSLKDNIRFKCDYYTDLINTLFNTHHLCNVKENECFHYDILAYSKIFYHLEVYNRKDIKRVYQECLKII